jgi:hypothetical protein
MGRRSRKRPSVGGPAVETTRAERDAARRARRAAAPTPATKRARPGRPSIDDRPPAPWGKFPLSELLVLLGIGFMVWGFVTWGSDGSKRFVGGLVLASLGGLELAVREHFAGYKSHSTMLAGACAFVVVTGLALGPGPHLVWILTLVAAVVFGAAFFGFRELFKRRSGGLGFR